MIKSMTGYGRAREMLHKRDITVEVRSVNNRYLDCTVKMPRMYGFAEDAVKQHVQKAISRGKVDVFITVDASAADVAKVTVNRELAAQYAAALGELAEVCGTEPHVTPETLSRFPDVLTVTKADEDLETVVGEGVLHGPAHVVAQAGMVAAGPDAPPRQFFIDAVHFLARRRIDDAAVFLMLLDVGQGKVELSVRPDDAEIQIRPVEAADEDAFLSEQATAGYWPSAYAAIAVIAVLGLLTTGVAEYIHKMVSKRMGMDV